MSSILRDQVISSVDQYISGQLQTRVASAGTIHARYQDLWQHISEATLFGGKRFRPYLTMVGYGEFSETIIPIAASQELIHTAMLVHDDVIDQDTMRRGQKNINGKYYDEYSAFSSPELATHYSYAASILAGDALVSEAYIAIANSDVANDIKTLLMQRLHLSIFEVTGGELIDTEASIFNTVTFDPLTIYRYKTAGYSFIGPLISGALCARADAETLHTLEQYGIAAGIGFQLQDDLLGVFGNEQELGKSVLIDLREGKQTHLALRHRALMNPEQATRFNEYFGNVDATDEQLTHLRDDIEASGARTETEQLVEDYFAEARSASQRITNDSQREELTALLGMLERRKA